jgi:Zn ribbon nucleic-acid-binding protein
MLDARELGTYEALQALSALQYWASEKVDAREVRKYEALQALSALQYWASEKLDVREVRKYGAKVACPDAHLQLHTACGKTPKCQDLQCSPAP